MRLHRVHLALTAFACVFFACDDAAEPAVPGAIAIAAGDAQTGAAGVPLAIAPAVRVLDTRGAPLGGVAVDFAVVAGDGAVEHAQATTAGDGTAGAGAWTLGPRVGPNALTATVRGLPPITFSANATPGPPATLAPVEGDGQIAPVGTRLPVTPSVRATDAFGNPAPGVPVRFTTEEGSGTIGVGIAATDATGIAHSGTWTLDTIAGTQRLRAFVDGGPEVVLSASATPDRAVRFRIASAAVQSGTVGAAADAPPAVVPLDRFGNPVPGTAVRFTVAAGGGSLHATADPDAGVDTLVVLSDAVGAATVARWTFGTRAGPQAVRARIVDDTVAALFQAEALPGPPTGLAIIRGQDQSAQAGTILAVRPAILAADAYQNPVSGLPVTFAALTGGGIVNLGETTTGADGTASPHSWILGLQAGTQAMAASSPGLPDAVFQATAAPGEPFEFEFFFINASEALQAAMHAAAARWQDALLAGQPDADGTIPAPFCGPVDQHGPYDDLRLILLIDSIDGPGQILASAGPCALRSSSRMPAVGGIALDSADIPMLLATGRLTDVLVHEIGHILGVGTRWGGGLLVGSDGDDPYFIGGAARSAFLDLGGSAYPGSAVPVENTGGPGTRNGHWRESVFHDELMTGFINAGANPLSAVSLASLQDVGYLVDVSHADRWTLTGALRAQSLDAAQPLPLRERAWPTVPVPLEPRR